VTIGGLSCVVQFWSQQRVVCTSPSGQGLNQAVYLTVGGQSNSPAARFDYSPPTIYSITPLRYDSQGGATMFINGKLAVLIQRASCSFLRASGSWLLSVVLLGSISCRNFLLALLHEPHRHFRVSLALRSDSYGHLLPAAAWTRVQSQRHHHDERGTSERTARSEEMLLQEQHRSTAVLSFSFT
jgi:hypothetical protein